MKKKRLIVAALIAGLLGYVLHILTIAGEFKTLESHQPGTCRLVEGPVGPEDFAVRRDRSGMFISSQDRRAHLQGASARGTIYYLDLTTPGAIPINVLPDAPDDFRPHGIGLWEDASRTRLFVVNHPGGNVHGDEQSDGPAHTIEVYDFDGSRLQPVETIAGELLFTPNDVAPVGPDSFYATNDHGSGETWLRKVEDYSRIGQSHIVFYDGEGFMRNDEVGTYRYANGIIASVDRKTIYMLATTDRALVVLSRDLATNRLEVTRSVDLGTGPDNLTLDAAGDLWIGAHPKMLTLAGHLGSAEGTSPSQVLRVRAADLTFDEIFLSDGTDLSASTVAAQVDDRLFIGSVFDPGFLVCER